MSPQFVDFNADGKLDIVAGTFSGSPYVAFGSAEGWKQPVEILDRDQQRILLNQFWNYDTKKWDTTKRCDPEGETPGEGHATSAVAFDWDADGDHDLLLGDHRSGRVFLRMNEGTAKEPRFATRNQSVLAAGEPIDVPGTVATIRLVDWNQDGRTDLACGSMGDAYGQNEGGGVYVFLNTGTKQAPAFGAPLVLVERSKKSSGDGPTRPDSGLYMDFADHDGDGDLDLVVGGYSHWKPTPPVLSAAQQQRVKELQSEIEDLSKRLSAFYQEAQKATEGLEEAAAEKARSEALARSATERKDLGQALQKAQKELAPLAPGNQRVSYVWLYENRAKPAARQEPVPASGGR